jgi:hypothetical protein
MSIFEALDLNRSMIRPSRPYIIDVEASGFGSESYPIEVGLALDPGERFCTLIRPPDDWAHWDEEAEALHKISREALFSHGRSVTEVATELNRRLENKFVFSDAWAVDNAWIVGLFAAARMEQAFSLWALESVVREDQIALWRETRDAVAVELGLERHRASNDAWIIQETFVRTLEMASSTRLQSRPLGS